MRHALNADAAGPVPLDLCAHLDEHLSQVGDLGLLRGVFQHRLALGQAGGHDEVLGAGHGDHVGGDARALQPRGAVGQARQHVPMLDVDERAHGLQALDVLIDRPRSDGATARQRHLGATKARQQRAQRQHRRAHGLDQLVRCLGRDGQGGVKAHAAALAMRVDLHAHVLQQLAHGAHVVQARHVDEPDRLGREQRGAHLGQRRVLGAGDGDLAPKRPAAADQQFVHRNVISSIKTAADA